MNPIPPRISVSLGRSADRSSRDLDCLKGASFLSNVFFARSAFRIHATPSAAILYVGIRPARAIDP